ncbi:phage minor structural protein [Clostridiaceae bacterium JG1575]|nr:phage minor structural protein [Clostridiaceae bacterium JG1575]
MDFIQNINNPTSEKTHLQIVNGGDFFTNLGDQIVVGGWINPTTYSVGQTYIPLFNTRQGPGQPLLYLSLFQGRPRMMLYNASGSLILDQTETPEFNMVNNGWYFIAAVIGVAAKTSQYILCDRSNGAIWKAPVRSFSGDLNQNCSADIIIGMHGNAYWYAGGFDDWFIETASSLTIDDLERYFRNAIMANGGDTSGEVDALTIPDAVTLKATSGAYPESGQLTTIAAVCALAGSGRVSVTSEYAPGVTSVSLVETSTSDDLQDWSAWQSVGANGELASPNRAYIRYRVTLATTDTSVTPKLLDITLHDIPKAPYDRLGYARPVVLDSNGAWEAVLGKAFDIIVTGEVNGADTLEFKLPYSDPKRSALDNEKQVQIAGDIYRVRTVTDEKNSDGSGILTTVYAEAAFYDLTFSVEKDAMEFNAALAKEPLEYALDGTGWSVGTVNVSTLRTWTCQEKNALAILRMAQQIHGGDLVFDSRNRQVSLLVFSGKDSGALFAYRKNLTGIKRVVDTRSLVTRLYAYGKDGMTFAAINNGKEYVEDFTYTSDVRVSTLDLSNFTNPYQMLEYTNLRLAGYAQPRVSYVLSAMDLSVLTGYEHEQWNLGDIVTVDDRDLGITIKTRVIRREYNLQEPWKTVLELSTKLRELGDSSNDALADQFGQSSLIGQEIKDMVPFNHLRNSRADDGFAYWQNSGFEVDAENGVTGTASFKAVGVSGSTKSMSQTVTPANRRNYTISAQIGSDNLVKGSNGQVGIELVFTYEDGSTETRFIDLY